MANEYDAMNEIYFAAAVKKSKAYTDEAVENVKEGISFVDSVEDLPAVGDPKTIYYVSTGTSAQDGIYDIYVWDKDASDYVYRGTTEINLEDYTTDEELDARVAPLEDLADNFSVEDGKLCYVVPEDASESSKMIYYRDLNHLILDNTGYGLSQNGGLMNDLSSQTDTGVSLFIKVKLSGDPRLMHFYAQENNANLDLNSISVVDDTLGLKVSNYTGYTIVVNSYELNDASLWDEIAPSPSDVIPPTVQVVLPVVFSNTISDGELFSNAYQNKPLALDETLQDLVAAVEQIADNVSTVVESTVSTQVAEQLPAAVEDQISPIVEEQVGEQIGDVVASKLPSEVAQQISTPVNQAVNTYCAANFSEWQGGLDSTLTDSSMAAPADKVGEIKSALTYITGSYTWTTFASKAINLDSDPVDVNTTEGTTDYTHCVIPCQGGDVFTVTATSNNNERIYAFLDSSYNRLEQSGKVAYTYDKRLLTAPTGSAYLVINLLKASPYTVLVGDTVSHIESLLRRDVDYLIGAAVCSIVSRYEKRYTTYYINSSGDLAYSGNWHTRVYRASDLVALKKVMVYGQSGYTAIGFYNSETIGAASFMSSDSKFFASGSTVMAVTFENVTIPQNAVLVAIVNRNATSANFTADAYLVNTINELDGEISNLQAMTYQKPRMKFGAHQGFRGIAPQNTIPSYTLAGLYGWDYAWIAQCKYSADGTWYVMHDTDVRTTTDAATVLPDLASYDINDLTDDEIAQIHVNVGSNVGDYDPSELYVPKLEEVIEICNLYGMGICFRVGMLPSNYNSGTAEERALIDSFVAIIRKYERQGDIFSGGANQILALREATGENWEGCIFLGENYTAQQVINALNSYGILENRSCLIPITTISGKEDVFLLHNNNVKYYAYKNVSPTKTELTNAAKWGVDIFQNGFKYKIE